MHDPSPAGVPLALVVHNIGAGTDPVPRADIEAVLQAAGMRTLYCAHGKGDLDAALALPFDLVVCAGGAGTLAHVASSLGQVERPIGVLPLGGSNNMPMLSM